MLVMQKKGKLEVLTQNEKRCDRCIYADNNRHECGKEAPTSLMLLSPRWPERQWCGAGEWRDPDFPQYLWTWTDTEEDFQDWQKYTQMEKTTTTPKVVEWQEYPEEDEGIPLMKPRLIVVQVGGWEIYRWANYEPGMVVR